MKHAWNTTCSYGVFDCFLSRLLLWRVLDKVDNNTASSGNAEHQLPSWSWMTHNQIEFFPDTKDQIDISGEDAIGFSSGQLYVQIRALQNCKIEQQGTRFILLDLDTNNVGELWFDVQANTQVQHCVVIGKRSYDNGTGAAATYFILLVSETQDSQYQRAGVGMIKAYHVSSRYQKGTLV
jgi:hypothetical protein